MNLNERDFAITDGLLKRIQTAENASRDIL